ncbi:MAG: thermonuclease family protein [Thermoleophilia bacterium]
MKSSEIVRFAAVAVAALGLAACQGGGEAGDAPPAGEPATAATGPAIGSATAGASAETVPGGDAGTDSPAAPGEPAQSVAADTVATPGSAPVETSGPPTQSAPDLPDGPRDTGVVRFVPDGDTLQLEDGRAVRLVQIDAPELNPADRAECHGREAQRLLRRLAPVGSTVELVRDPALDDVDRFDRLLRYVRVDGHVLNVTLVAEGAATPYFFRGDRGRLAGTLLAAAREARAAGRGLWGACPAAELQPGRGADTGRP